MNSMNIALFRFINDLGLHLNILNPLIVFIAEYGVVVLALWMISLWFWTSEKVQTRATLISATFVFLLSEVIAKIGGLFITHPQPFATLPNVQQLISHEIDNSFPSDHTILFFSICTTLFLTSKSTKRIFYLIAASIVGLARIWVGVHYPIDVLTAAFIGIVVACSLSSFLTRSRIVLSIVNLYNHLTKRFKKVANDQTNISEREG